ncbi:VTT domain-containing protein, partial [Litoricolaceae bacterium]|nr:VTT domain-containing protein [Litorivicinaceae bacterium]
LFFLSYVASVSFSLPIASFLTLAGSAVFGWVALPTIVLAATTGAFLVFILASTVAREFFFSRADVVLDRVRSVFAKSPIRWLLTMRLIPFFPFWLVNILPALLSMKSRDYLFATLIGILPGTAIYVAVGRGLDTILTAGDEPDWNLLQSPEVWLPLVLLGSLTAVSAVLKSRHQ